MKKFLFLKPMEIEAAELRDYIKSHDKYITIKTTGESNEKTKFFSSMADILCMKTNSEIDKLKKTYNELYKVEIADDINKVFDVYNTNHKLNNVYTK
jgi:hypothetical protein